MALLPEQDGISRDVLRAAAIDLDHPPGVVKTFNMRVYEVPQDVADAVTAERSQQATESKKPKAVRRTPTSHKEASDGDKE